MRAITQESVRAFFGGYYFKKANMLVQNNGARIEMRLHNNLIAYRNHEGIFISNAGWESNTTKERLNGILSRLGSDKIYQKDFTWYLGKIEFPCGEFVKVD